MKSIKHSDEIWRKLNEVKYKWGYKTMDEVIEKLFEIAESFKTAQNQLKKGGKK